MEPNKGLILFAIAALALLQSSFLINFEAAFYSWFKYLNLIVIFIVVISLFENRWKTDSFYYALAGGFMLDLFSESYFGLWILVCLAASAVVKYIVKSYVRIPSYW